MVSSQIRASGFHGWSNPIFARRFGPDEMQHNSYGEANNRGHREQESYRRDTDQHYQHAAYRKDDPASVTANCQPGHVDLRRLLLHDCSLYHAPANSRVQGATRTFCSV
jgi:hypothetical protein